jgi:hypothetical protein
MKGKHMPTKKQPKLHRLLVKLQKKPMRYTDISKFLGSKLWDTALYGDYTRHGIFERFCQKDAAGRWYVPPHVSIEAPYTKMRSQF